MHQYDDQVAYYYASYRPPLHAKILKKVLSGRTFKLALDIGCGTGQSTIPLVKYCQTVIGVDQSPEMIKKTSTKRGLEFKVGSAEDIPVEDNVADLITLAGVVSYLNPELVIPEFHRVCVSGASIVSYDFKVEMDPVLAAFSIKQKATLNGYDHSTDFAGCDGIEVCSQSSEKVSFGVTAREAACLVLSNSERIHRLSSCFDSGNLLESVVERIEKHGWNSNLSAEIFYSVHRLKT